MDEANSGVEKLKEMEDLIEPNQDTVDGDEGRDLEDWDLTPERVTVGDNQVECSVGSGGGETAHDARDLCNFQPYEEMSLDDPRTEDTGKRTKTCGVC